ncbi:LOW QUALITY PROTEIN: synaptotagmin-15 [Pungitius pungitius]|uniref:LOW QUALITY PROTEIN: synaptotagmin-15 n=1 Tax=Pungitius pungitius TaxID=134920 RepID=UPI002E153339
MADRVLLRAVGASVVLLLLLCLMVYFLWRSRRNKNKGRSQYEELLPSVAARSAPVILVSQDSVATLREIPFTVPPRLPTQNQGDLKNEEEAEMKTETQRDILAHRGSLSVSRWYPVGTVLAGLYPLPPLNEVVAPPPGMATRLCFSVEYRHSSEQLAVSLLRLGNLPPRFHGNATLVELRRLPDDRRPRQAKARGTGPDPEFSDRFVFQVERARAEKMRGGACGPRGTQKSHRCLTRLPPPVVAPQVACACVPRSTLSVCVLSVAPDGKRHAVGRVLVPLEGELGQAGRVLWRDLETEDHVQCSELGDVQISLSYSPSLQRLSVVVLRARGLQLLTDAGVCVQASLQIHTQVVKMKRSRVVKCHNDPSFHHRVTFKLRPQHLDEACLRFELQQPNGAPSEPPALLGVLVLGPFMYARGQQLQHWMDMVNTPQEAVELWHGLGRAA